MGILVPAADLSPILKHLPPVLGGDGLMLNALALPGPCDFRRDVNWERPKSWTAVSLGRTERKPVWPPTPLVHRKTQQQAKKSAE